MKLSSEVKTTRIRGTKSAPFSHQVIREEPLALFVNDEAYVTLMRMPGNEKELIIGFLFTEGIIKNLDEVLYLKHCGSGTDEEQNRVDVRLAPGCKVESNRKIEARSACGLCSRTYIDDLVEEMPTLSGNEGLISIETLKKIESEINRHQPLFKETGAVHAAGLYDKTGKLLILMEDIGRHNALDKIIGYALMRSWKLTDKILVSTGRASFEMAYKTLRAEIPVMASVSAPTSMALDISKRFGLTLIGFFRREGFNIYTFPERVLSQK